MRTLLLSLIAIVFLMAASGLSAFALDEVYSETDTTEDTKISQAEMKAQAADQGVTDPEALTKATQESIKEQEEYRERKKARLKLQGSGKQQDRKKKKKDKRPAITIHGD